MIFWIAAIVVTALDQWTKSIVVGHMMPSESRIFIPHVVWWTYVQNTRGAFGLFGDQPLLLIGLAAVVLVLFYWAFRDLAARSVVVRAAFGAIVGGAVGNVIDRVTRHFVVDFIDFRWWPVFNAADSFITIGVIVLIFTSLARDRTPAASGGAPS